MMTAALAAPVAGLAQRAPAAAAPVVTPVAIAPTAPQAARPRPTVREGVVALVNDDLISTYDLKQQVSWLSISNAIPLTAQNMPELQRRALDELIDQRLQEQEMRRWEEKMTEKRSLFADDKDVDAYLSQLASQNKLTLDQFLGELARSGISAAFIRRQTRTGMSWEEFSGGLYAAKVRISPEQVKAVEEQMATSAAKPSYLVSEIFIDAQRAGGLQQARTQADQVLTQIAQGARFETVALQLSSKPTAATGGDAGWMATVELDPSVAAALENMRPGQVSRPIPVADGVYVVMLREKRAGGGALVVNLKQAAVALPTDATAEAASAAQQKLLSIKAKGATCQNLAALAGGVSGVEVGDLGETELKELNPTFRTAIETLETEQVSDPVRTGIGLHLVAVCGRRTTGVNMPTREQIERKLESEQIAMLVRRELRNLRAAATISQPQ